ncbi:LCP family protein [Brachybacterium saurashtrense]|uniref:LytR family transcriptional regulator n=1 Tax=Brachybacterium saurashtrense TaxID=556288 RepID=A0A345YT72_9MICO|nr:LCP family protein [Brachybacterium saurashtrense]AXK47124.1 LytR family transcriptional regulator [Brachybacterium saurashtrense]RRR23446.1 LytR family transcriptional regulator [Brachybacterium saurashtrense]
MTDPSSDSSRRRRRSGRHRHPARRPQSPPLPDDQARRNRDAAFGTSHERRTWIGSGPVESPSTSEEPTDGPSVAPTGGRAAAPSPAEAAPTPAPERDQASPAAGSARAEHTPHREESPHAERPRRRGRRAAFPLEQLPDAPGGAGASARSADDAWSAGSAGSAASAGADGDAWSPDTGASAESAGLAAESALSAGSPSTSPSRGRRRAAPAEPTTATDLWAIQEHEDAPLAPPAGAAAVDAGTGPGTAQEASPAGREPAPAAASAPPSAARSFPRATTASPGATSSPGARVSPAAAAASPTAAAAAGAGAGGRSPQGEGSLPRVAGWTVLTSLLPGSGLLTTRMRRLGAAILVLLLLAVLGAAAFLLFGDPLRTGAMLATRRGVLIGAMIAVAVVGVLWGLQIVLANLAHSTRERLAGAKRYLALGLAALMVVAIAVPFGRGVQSLWALQRLMGSESVFGGGDGSSHPFSGGEDPWADTERLNIMLLGQDAGADRTGTRPDTIMVASIDTATGQTALFSIPRNLEKVEFPEGTAAAEVFPDGFDYFGPNQDLINAVWTWAEDRPDLFPGDPEPGLTATRWAVEETLGLETDYYAMVNLQGFQDMVDAIGGVDLVVERRIPIGGGASEVEGYIEPGAQKLDGFHALWYARSREGSNDFNRMCRQQRIVRAVSEEADPTTLALSIPRLVTATEDNIVTDIPVSDLDAFVELALRIKDGGFTSYPITQDVTYSGNPDFEYLEEWVQASIADSMTRDEPESVVGETEPGSTEPAETGAAPEEESEAEDPQEEESSAPEEESSSSPAEDGADGEEESSAPEIEQDPLKSCLPGYEG